MTTITISKKEYQGLLDVKLRYEYLRQLMSDDLFSPPPVKSAKSVALSFRKTGKYSQKFLKSLEVGLKRSKYAYNSH